MLARDIDIDSEEVVARRSKGGILEVRDEVAVVEREGWGNALVVVVVEADVEDCSRRRERRSITDALGFGRLRRGLALFRASSVTFGGGFMVLPSVSKPSLRSRSGAWFSVSKSTFRFSSSEECPEDAAASSTDEAAAVSRLSGVSVRKLRDSRISANVAGFWAILGRRLEGPGRLRTLGPES